jgi:hypothetical protein
MSDDQKQIREKIEDILSIVRFQVLNGMLDKEDWNDMIQKLDAIKGKLDNNSDFSNLAGRLDGLKLELYNKLNSKSLKERLLYLYAIHVWLFLILGILVALGFLIDGYLRNLIVGGVSADVVLWGFLGGCAYSIYYLRKNIWQLQFSKYYAIYYITYTFAGAAFGFGVAILVAAGLVSLQSKPSYAVYAGISFISGSLQSWVMSLIQTIAQAIHKSD